MKRLLGLAVLFVILSASVPSYGYFLIYNLSSTVKGVNNSTPVSISWKAYLVLSFDNSDNAVDANMIMYGKDSNNVKVYVQLNYSDSAHLFDSDSFWQKGASKAFDFWSESDHPFDFVGFVIGKSKTTNIGLSNTKNIAGSLTGTMIVWDNMLFNASDNIAGSGTVSMSLDLKTTKLVNANGWTQENIIETGGTIAGKHQKSLIEILTAQHYNPATLP
ncbi:MAG: hypothetical protein ABSF37_02120 [Sedimentisphaerales bacterium]|jgi:hypothetical protein